jgi:poly-beta-1,6-N-acetyl-D-glucosamine synthase
MGVLELGLAIVLTTSIAAIAYHYMAYPLIVAAACRLWARPQRPNESRPGVSLVIAAYNEEAVIEEKIANSLALDYPDLQIIVVCDGSDDRTVDHLSRFEDRGIVVLHKPERTGKADALGRAVAVATGNIVVFSDANAMYRPDAISALVAAFSDDSVGAVSGGKTVRPRGTEADSDSGFARSEGLYWRYENLIRRSESRLGSTVASVGEMFAIRRSLFRPIPPGVVNDDLYLTLDLLGRGYSVRYAPDAQSEELASLSVSDEIARRRRIAAGRWGLLSNASSWPWRRPWLIAALLSHKAMRLVMPFAFAAALVSNAALLTVNASAPVILLFAAQVLFYAAGAVGGQVGRRPGMLWKAARVSYFLIRSNMSVLFGFLDWIAGRNVVNWTKATR